MADIFDVLADGTRREILRQLLESRGELAVGDLVNELGIAQPTVSKHLKVLREHGLVGVREEGQHRYYHLDASPLEEVEADMIRLAFGRYRGRMTEMAKHLGMGRTTLYRRMREIGLKRGS